MTGVALPRPRGVALPARRPASTLALELALFGALGLLAVIQWSRLVDDAPAGRLLAVLAIVTAGGAVLALVGRRRDRIPYFRLVGVAIVLATLAAATVAVGLPPRLLLLSNWAELLDGLSLGLAGVEDTDLPYRGEDYWLRLTLLCGAPLLLGIASALAFWPSRRRALWRVAALAAIVVLYGIAVTLDSPGGELLWGAALLVLATAWLWAPSLAPGRRGVAFAVAAAAGLLALPLAGRLDPAGPWWNYESWDWFGRDREVTFDWNHSYGPLDWPREGTTMLEVRSTQPLYWKASVLDRFDGFVWERAREEDPLALPELAARRRTPGGELPNRRRDWLTQASFEVEALTTGLVIGAGTAQVVQGIEGVTLSADGTMHAQGALLAAGEEYSVVSYSPQPSADELRAAPGTYPERFERSTLVAIPTDEVPTRAQSMPLWGEPLDELTRLELLASPYGDVYRLARRLTANANTPYAAAEAIERHLRSSYEYSPEVPDRAYPLASFLFEDRAGYCQQFAGSMALMLRMIGIPSRVASGFAPGSYDGERELYEIRDTDAHSWVEVYFRGIGWVTFDPTPADAPAASRTQNLGIGDFFRGRGAVAAENDARVRSADDVAAAAGGGGAAESGGGPWAAIALGLAGAAVVAGALAASGFWRRRRALVSGTRVDAQLAELRAAIGGLGWKLPPQGTLLAIEARFRSSRYRPIARYAAALRAHRFAPDPPPPPGPDERRALRRALAGGGLRRRLRGLRAIPPGGPR